MAEMMAPEMRQLGEPFAPSPDSPWAAFGDDSAVEFAGNKTPTYYFMRRNKDDPAVEAPVNKAAVAGSDSKKAASSRDFDTKPAGNKAAPASSIEAKAAPASSIEAAAAAEDKAKQAAAEVEDKAKQAAAEDKAKQAAAAAEDKAKQAAAAAVEDKAKQAPGSGIKPARGMVGAKFMEKLKAAMTAPNPKVVEVRTEMVPENFILRLKKKPMPRPSVPSEQSFNNNTKLYESVLRTIAIVNSEIDVYDDMVRQYDEKGYAVMGVRVMDSGMKKWFILPEEATA